MSYQSTITKKGQITIPKKIREELGLKTPARVLFEFSKKKKKVTIRRIPDILEIAGSFKVKNPVSPLKTRKEMEKSYQRF